MKNNTNKLLLLSGYSLSFVISITMFIIFINAYLHGFQTLVTINTYGEAQIELLMLLLIIPVVGIVLFNEWIRYLGYLNKKEIKKI